MARCVNSYDRPHFPRDLFGINAAGRFVLSGTAVPKPSTAALALIGIAVLICFSRRWHGKFSSTAELTRYSLVVALIGTHCFWLRAQVQLDMLVQLTQGRNGFGFADGIVKRKVGAQPVAVFHQDMPTKA
jgi:hypothetical protein